MPIEQAAKEFIAKYLLAAANNNYQVYMMLTPLEEQFGKEFIYDTIKIYFKECGPSNKDKWL
jgi:hypothetical protein